MVQGEQFIDEDSGYSGQKNTYEEIVLKQIRETAVLLSKELTGSKIKRENKIFTRGDDLRVQAYNAVDTLRMLLVPFIKNKDSNDEITKIKKEIKDYLKTEGEKEVMVQGKGMIKIKNLIQDDTDIHYNLMLEFKLDKARELFEALIVGYQKNKSYIASFETE